MKVGVPTEIKTDEYRVSLTPAGVRELTERGHEVYIQAGAGVGSTIPDEEYEAQGAKILPDAPAVFDEAELVLGVKEPQPAEVAMLRPDHLLFTYLHLAPDPELTRGLVESGATCVAYETVVDDHGRLPLLAPMSEVAGKIATQAGAFFLERPLGGRGVLLGGVPGVAAAKVMVIGGGVVGQNAAFIAIGMEAEVYVYDRNIDRLRELDVTFGGRASTVYSSTLAIEEMLPAVDLVIGAVLVHGAKAPFVIKRDQLALMKQRAVLVDVSIDQGGCFETSRATTHSDPVYEVDGVTHYCVANMPGAVPVTSTFALTNATLPVRAGARRPGRRRGHRQAARPQARRERGRRQGDPPSRGRGHGHGLHARGRRVERGGVGGVRMSIATKTKLQNFIDGELVDAAEGATEEVTNPANGEVIAEMPLSTEEDVNRAVAAAKSAFGGWAATPPGERANALFKLADLLEEHAEELSDLEAADAGKPRAAFFEDEMPFLCDNLRFFGGAGRVMEGKAAMEFVAGRTSIIRREPIGVVGQITPWNYPLMMAIWKIGPALATGNTIVLKPAESTPISTVKLAELAGEVLPRGVLNVITGHGKPAGSSLVTHPDVEMVSLTGSPGTGKWIAAAASETLKRVHLELGGKAPVVVFDDTDLDTALEAIAGAGLYNAGQDCTAATRILASAKVYDDVVSGLAEQAKGYKVGDTFDPETTLGPLNSQLQRERVEGFLERRPSNAEIVTGGGEPDLPGAFLEPTVIAGLGQDDEMVQNEIFGPVMTVQQFDDEAKAIEWANGTRYGLSASVWTRDIARAHRVANALRFGCVWVNDHITMATEMPHGGYKQSGYGKDMSMYALEDYTEVKHVMVNLETE